MKKLVVKIMLVSLLGVLFSSYALAQTDDKEPPSGVDKVEASAFDSKITLKWDSATDNVEVNHYKIYYGTEPVTSQDQEYPNSVKTTGPVTTYEVTGLENGITYYFVVTALDKAGNESDEYSYEKSATPKAVIADAKTDANDKTAPTVVGATSLGNTELKVVFSEKIKLPSDKAEKEFTIENQEEKKTLEVIGAIINPDDASGKTVILTVEPQTSKAKYLLTVGLNVTDANNNPIVSGTSDTATFEGKGEGEEATSETAEETANPEVISATAYSSAKVEVTFSKEVNYGSELNFLVKESTDDTKEIKVLKASYGDSERVVILETEEQTGGKEYLLTVSDITDKSGNPVDSAKVSTLFITPEKDVSDIVPPEDVTNLISKLKGNLIELTWTPSANSAKDLADQLLYKSTDKGAKYDKAISLGPKATKYQLKGLKAGIEYTLKLTAKDFSGNESKGAITTITIPKTGAGLGIITLLSLGFSGFITRKKK